MIIIDQWIYYSNTMQGGVQNGLDEYKLNTQCLHRTVVTMGSIKESNQTGCYIRVVF